MSHCGYFNIVVVHFFIPCLNLNSRSVLKNLQGSCTKQQSKLFGIRKFNPTDLLILGNNKAIDCERGKNVTFLVKLSKLIKLTNQKTKTTNK